MKSELALFEPGFLENLWLEARKQLRAQLELRAPAAVFLEGSLAEGFGNQRSDIDFVAVVDDGTKVATMPYILFISGRRIEVRLLSRQRLERELQQLRMAYLDGLRETSSRIGWNMLERCQRFMGCIALENPTYIEELQLVLGREALSRIIVAWFADFAAQTFRYAVAMVALGQAEIARGWIRTAVFHAAKSYVARRGELYLGSKWLALQIERSAVDADLRERLRSLSFEARADLDMSDYLAQAARFLGDLGVVEVAPRARGILFGARSEVTTWQIGQHVHVLRGSDVFRLGPDAAKAWRSLAFHRPVPDLVADARDDAGAALRQVHYYEFVRAGLISLRWDTGEAIRVNERGQSRPTPFDDGPLLCADGARWLKSAKTQLQLLPLPALRFAEAGVNLTWANIGVENAREDSLGALAKGQFGVLEYTLQRMVQAAALVALAAHGVTPQVALEEATSAAIDRLTVPPEIVSGIRCIERTPIASETEARAQLGLAERLVAAFRSLGDEELFPASFDSAEGWCETILYGYDWFNLAAHLDAPFPASAVGGRGTAEEARDLLASNVS